MLPPPALFNNWGKNFCVRCCFPECTDIIFKLLWITLTQGCSPLKLTIWYAICSLDTISSGGKSGSMFPPFYYNLLMKSFKTVRYLACVFFVSDTHFYRVTFPNPALYVRWVNFSSSGLHMHHFAGCLIFKKMLLMRKRSFVLILHLHLNAPRKKNFPESFLCTSLMWMQF